MNATATLKLADLRVVQLTQHWTIEHGVFYRDAVVKLPDGTVQLVRIRDEVIPAVAA